MKLASVVFVTLFLLGCGGVNSQAPNPPSVATSKDPVLTRISLSPATASIHVGDEQAFLAQALDQYDHPMTGVTFDWSSSDDGANGNAIAMFHGGIATGISAGVMHVTASASGVTSAPAALTVLAPPPTLATVLVTPSQPSVLAGGAQQFSAVGKDQYGNEIERNSVHVVQCKSRHCDRHGSRAGNRSGTGNYRDQRIGARSPRER